MYASELAEKKRHLFLLVYADQTVEEALEMLASIQPPPEVIVLATPAADGWQYDMLLVERAAERLVVAEAGQTTGQVFDGALRRPAAILKPSDPVDPELMFFVVEEDGIVVGCYYPEIHPLASAGEIMGDQSEPPAGEIGGGKAFTDRDVEEVYVTGSLAGETGKGAAPGAPPAPPSPPERYLQSEFPESLVVGEEGDLAVWVTCLPDESGYLRLGASLNLATGDTLDVVVRAEVGIKLTGQSYGRITIPAGEGDSARLRIGLRAEQAGMGRLKVYCMHNGVSLGAIAVTVTIYADEAAAREAQPAYHSTQLPPITAGRAPTLTLWVFEERIEEQAAVRYLLNDAKSNQPPAEYGPLVLDEAPRERFSRYLAEVERLLRTTTAERIDDARIEMQLRGELLFQELFPPELQRVLAERQDEIESIHILSQEAWIPWEMVRLYGADAAGNLRGRYLCEYLLTRWNPDYPPQTYLSLKSIGVISPGAAEEMNMLNLLQEVGSFPNAYEVTYLPDGLSPLVIELTKGSYTCLHFSGYERSMDEKFLRSGILLEKGRRLYAQNFGGSLSACCKAHPLVFLNTCQTQPDAPHLTGLDGWANQFMAIGAAAFVGTHWSVSDQAAAAFASVFYSSLLLGQPVSAALREARKAVQEQLPTLDWLAYAGFCDPAAVQR